MTWLGEQINRQLEPHLAVIPEGEWLEVEFLVRMVVYRKKDDIEIEAGYLLPHHPTWSERVRRWWGGRKRK